MILLLLGAPGSGKGTQGRHLAENFGIPYLSSGDLLRRAIEQHTSFGMQVREYIERGLYVPDELLVPVVIAELNRLRHTQNEAGAVLDGFPRTADQAVAMDAALEAEGVRLDQALLLDVPKEVLIPRLAGRRVCRSCGASYHAQTKPPHTPGVCDVCGGEVIQRVDDKPEMVDGRLTVYLQRTLPLVAHYNKQGRLTRIDGNRPEDQVTAALIAGARQPAPSVR